MWALPVAYATASESCAEDVVLIQGLKRMHESVRHRDNFEPELGHKQPCETKSEPDVPQRGRDFSRVLTDMTCPIEHKDRLFRFPESRETDLEDQHFPVETCYSACFHTGNCHYFSYGMSDGGNVCIGCPILQHTEDDQHG